MRTTLASAVSPEWLALREPADHRARSRHLAGLLSPRLPPGDVIIHDLGSGTGSMTRWLAPQLPRAQHWVLHDLDPALLAHSAIVRPGLTIDTRHGDVTAMDASQLRGAALVTTSALLDLLTGDEVTRIASACVGSNCPALFTLTVTGRVQLTPRHPLDASVEAAFNAHQRRTVGGRRLLGPDAVTQTTSAFRRLGADVLVAETPWRLGADDAQLVVEWLAGWVDAACEQRPDLAEAARGYLRQRVTQAASGRLQVTVGHADLLAVPEQRRSNRGHPAAV